jgi:hypothetical protein
MQEGRGKTYLLILVILVHEMKRFSEENFSGTQPGFGANFRITGCFLNAAISFLKRFTERILSVYKNIDKKENKIFLIYKEIQNGADAKSYMRKGFLIYKEMRKYLTIYERLRRPLVIYDFATAPF